MSTPITLYFIGHPGTGKYSIAKELVHAGYKIADNHLINNPIFALLDRNAPIPDTAWDAIEHIRTAIYNFIALDSTHHYVLTNVLYDTAYDREIYEAVEHTALQRHSRFIPVKLHISPKENARRITQAERAARFKTITVQKDLPPLIDIRHPHLIELDVTTLSAKEAAQHILNHI